MSYLTFKGATKIFGKRGRQGIAAVNDLHLEVQKGELMVILGPSGCGKTTLLRLAVGLEELTRGDILLSGRSITDLAPHKRPFALVFQNYALYPHLTAAENMTLGLRRRGVSKARIQRRLRDAMEVLRLGRDELKRKPAELSGGQRQRAALGKAIMRKPEVFLLDEPMSNLDQKLRIHLRRELRRIQRALNATMLLVTHDQAEAASLGDRVALINKGRIEQVGRPLDLYENPRNLFVAQFIANPSMNLVRGVLLGTGEGPVFQEIGGGGIRLSPSPDQGAFLASRLGKEVMLGIMPEFVRVVPAAPGHARAETIYLEACAPFAYLHLDTGAHRICCLARHTARTVGRKRVNLAFDLNRILFFDPASGARISPPRQKPPPLDGRSPDEA